ncbi:probable G-protein coupled receptor Mth-like 5 [Halyomorpha halys]|uniref:probable G-protein coupled receptor Mth-like 5 n=1 Tax=Halyomorpha halys TaxID=286706 RepID=UPI0006D50E65|nr:probable G-protein coupled receptor Mth-like 5 [Halyomorpha halys]
MEVLFLFIISFSYVFSSNIPPPRKKPPVLVQKCCKKGEIFVDKNCAPVNETTETEWEPQFMDENGRTVSNINYKILTGIPSCGNRQSWEVYHKALDKLRLLPDGTLRHYIITAEQGISDEELNQEEVLQHDYRLGFYCNEKVTFNGNTFDYAIVCPPDVSKSWKDTDFILRKILDPVFHIIAILCYVTVAIVHFVLPQLRDMVGNIITTMCVCLIVAQAADTCRIFTEFTSPVGFLVADIIMFISLIGAYFWLASFGFYIWKTFRSPNVFLRITDGKKYCYYSYWVWSSTIMMSIVATFSHFTLDIPDTSEKPGTPIAQGTALGILGIAVFFSPVACTVLADIYFYLSTLQVMSTVASYGRIHHKLKYCFETFIKIFLIMAVSWLFLMLSWLPYSGMYYCYIFINALEAPLILYISVLSQRRVRFLLRKVCCFEKCVCPCFRPNQPNDVPEWGEEMMAMNR